MQGESDSSDAFDGGAHERDFDPDGPGGARGEHIIGRDGPDEASDEDVDTSAEDFQDAADDMPPKPNSNPVLGTSAGASNGGDNEVPPLTYDMDDKPDQPDAPNKLNSIANLPWDSENVDKWVRRLERRMETAGVGLQWTKRLVLELAVPPHVHNDLDDLFDKERLNCGLIYQRCKTLLLELHGPRPERDIELALAMVVPPGQTPLQTAQKLVKLICKDRKPLVNCCCSNLVSTRWRQLIPQQVRTHVAGLGLKTEYTTTMKVADNVWRSLQPGQQQVAAV